MPQDGRRRAWTALVPVVAVVAGFMFAASAATADGTDLRSGRRFQLAELIVDQERRVADYDRRTARLRAEVSAATRDEERRDARVATIRERADALAPAAGLTAVTGPAVTVTLDDAPRPPEGSSLPGDPSPDDLVVHQQDVQAVVNALWAGGAEALTIMGERVISTTAVRCVGNTLLLHGRVYSPPFAISAIGDPDAMRAALDASPAVQTYLDYVDAFGLGYDVETRRSTTFPAYDRTIELVHVRPPRAAA